MKKTSYPIDKRKWSPSLIPGLVVLVSTCNCEGEPNVAPKSWIQMVSFEPPILMFSGTKGNPTEDNILETGCFGMNIIDSSMAETVYRSIRWHGRQRIEKCGFAVVPASKIKAPLVDRCRAHLECRLIDTQEVGSGFVIYGEILAASIDEEILRAGRDKRYELLDQILFLEDGLYGLIGDVRKID